MDNEKLIELVREYPFLYDVQDKMYNDSYKKDGAWRVIAQKMKKPEKDCKKAWNALRDGFRRAIKRYKEAKSENLPTKKWKFEDDMAFLVPYLKERNPINTSADENTQNDIVCDLGTLPVNNPVTPQLPVLVLSQSETTRPEIRDSVRRRHQFPKKIAAHQGTSSTTRKKHILSRKDDDDEILSFFSSIAATVRKFPPRQRAIAKAEVFAAVSKLELEILSQSTAHTEYDFYQTSPRSVTSSHYSSDSSQTFVEVGPSANISNENKEATTF